MAQVVLSDRTVQLEQRVHDDLYASKFDSAQSYVFAYLDQPDLTTTEKTYGQYLRSNIRRASGSPEAAINILHQLRQQIHHLPKEEHNTFEALFLGKIAECYFDKQVFDTAAHFAQRSIATHLTNPLRSYGHAINYIMLGGQAVNLTQYDKGQQYYQQAIAIYSQHKAICELPLCYIKTAHLSMRLGNNKSALVDLNRALFLSDSCDINQYRFLSRGALVQYYKHMGEYEKALIEYEKFTHLSDLIYQERQQVYLNGLQIQYETKLAKAENEQLRQDALLQEQKASNRVFILMGLISVLLLSLLFAGAILWLRQAKNAKLKEQLQQIQRQKQERDALLKEVHHRVKNNLQVITSLLHLQAAQQQPVLVGGTIENPFQSSQDRINTLALVHEFLYQSETMATIPLRGYLEGLFNTLMHRYADASCPVSLTLDVPPLELDLDTATPLGLLFNEILTNSLLHGFCCSSEGELYVKGEQNGQNKYVFYIGDNGKGCEEDVHFDRQNSLGFSLMRKLARQLQGNIQQIHHEAQGCHYKLTIKLT